MKTILLTLAFVAFSLVTATADDKKTTTTTTTTYGSGTITEYTPGSTFVLKEESGPVTYKYGDSVTYVTKSGTVLTEEHGTSNEAEVVRAKAAGGFYTDDQRFGKRVNGAM